MTWAAETVTARTVVDHEPAAPTAGNGNHNGDETRRAERTAVHEPPLVDGPHGSNGTGTNGVNGSNGANGAHGANGSNGADTPATAETTATIDETVGKAEPTEKPETAEPPSSVEAPAKDVPAPSAGDHLRGFDDFPRSSKATVRWG